MGPHALMPGMSFTTPKQGEFKWEDIEEEPGRMIVLERLGKIDKQVGIYEQVGSMGSVKRAFCRSLCLPDKNLPLDLTGTSPLSVEIFKLRHTSFYNPKCRSNIERSSADEQGCRYLLRQNKIFKGFIWSLLFKLRQRSFYRSLCLPDRHHHLDLTCTTTCV